MKFVLWLKKWAKRLFRYHKNDKPAEIEQKKELDDPVYNYLKGGFPKNIEIMGAWIETPEVLTRGMPSKMLKIRLRDKKSGHTSIAPYNHNKLKRQLKKEGKI